MHITTLSLHVCNCPVCVTNRTARMEDRGKKNESVTALKFKKPAPGRIGVLLTAIGPDLGEEDRKLSVV